MNDNFTIFFSGQSDRSQYSDYIKKQLNIAKKEIEGKFFAKGSLLFGCGLETGSPYIPETILSNINLCDIYVADVSGVCECEHGNRSLLLPNPNVIYELGFADRAKKTDVIVLLKEKESGDIEKLPFDFCQRRISSFSIGSNESNIPQFIISAYKKSIELKDNHYEANQMCHDREILIAFFNHFKEDNYNDILDTLATTNSVYKSQLCFMHEIVDFWNREENRLLTKSICTREYLWIRRIEKTLQFLASQFYPVYSGNADYRLSWIDKNKDDETDEHFLKKKNKIEFAIPRLIASLSISYANWRFTVKQNLFI